MSVLYTSKPKFSNEHPVKFAGGEGIVRSARLEFGRWTYVVEMALGTEPEFGRVGHETTVLLDEADLYAAYSGFQISEVQ